MFSSASARSSGGELLCMDACADEWQALARLPLDGGAVYRVEAHGSFAAALLDTGEERTVMRYALASWRCVARPTFEAPVLALLPEPVMANDDEVWAPGTASPGFRFSIPAGAEVRGVLRDELRAIVWVTSPSEACFEVCETGTRGTRERWVALALDVLARGMRLDGDFLTVWDALGRVHSLHLPTASLSASLPIEGR